MSKVDRDIISKAMGCEPIMFNAGLVSAQCRKRLFWTNIKFELPVDNNILLKDILQSDAEVDDRMIVRGKAFTLTASYLKVSASEAQIKNSIEKKQRTMVKFRQIGHIGKTSSQGNRVYNTDGKSVCLSANGGGLGAKTGLYTKGVNPFETPLINGGQGVTPPNVNLTHGGQAHRVYDIDAKSPTLSQCSPIVKGVTPTIRKLTPIECERLQSLPDNYTEGISNTQRYKCLGNAFNCAVIQHILKGIVN
jgi:DNA (cytosine-5)-methyltransferase 3A